MLPYKILNSFCSFFFLSFLSSLHGCISPWISWNFNPEVFIPLFINLSLRRKNAKNISIFFYEIVAKLWQAENLQRILSYELKRHVFQETMTQSKLMKSISRFYLHTFPPHDFINGILEEKDLLILLCKTDRDIWIVLFTCNKLSLRD